MKMEIPRQRAEEEEEEPVTLGRGVELSDDGVKVERRDHLAVAADVLEPLALVLCESR